MSEMPPGEYSRSTKKPRSRQSQHRSNISGGKAPPRPPLPNKTASIGQDGASSTTTSTDPRSNSATVGALREEPSITSHESNEPALPSYTEACQNDCSSTSLYPNISHRTRNFRAMSESEVNAVLDSMLNEHVEVEANAPMEQETLDVLLTINDAQIYFISPSGLVSAPSYPDDLRILSSGEPCSNYALLQVGPWTYPLLPGQSPTLQCNTGCYIFPDVAAPEPGSSVGVILPNMATAAERRHFEILLNDLTVMQMQTPIPSAPAEEGEQLIEKEVRTSDKISEGLAKGGELIGLGLSKGAEKTSQLIKFGASKLKQKLAPESKSAVIDPRVQKGLNVVKDTSVVAVVVTGFLVSKLGDATMALGRAIAPHVEEYGSKIISKASGANKQESKATISDVMNVAGGGLKGFAAVYLGLENAGKILATNIKNETVQIVDEKYGKDAASATEKSLSSAVNLAFAARNIAAFGPKALAKRTAKDAGKAVIQGYNANHTHHR